MLSLRPQWERIRQPFEILSVPLQRVQTLHIRASSLVTCSTAARTPWDKFELAVQEDFTRDKRR